MKNKLQQTKIGLRIKQHRLERGFIQSELAEKIGVKQPKISQYERGLALPDIIRFTALCRVLNTTPNQLLNHHG